MKMEKVMKRNMVVIVIWTVFVSPAFSQQNALPDIEEVKEYTASGYPAVIYQWYLNASEDVFVGIGIGNLSTLVASIEQAKFNAHADLCRELYFIVRSARNTIPGVPKSVVDRLDFYQSAYYGMVSIFAADHAAFELYGLTTVEQRLRTKDGKIWYLVTLDKNKAEKQLESLEKAVKEAYESMIEDWQEK
jgi:hypothetical protein